MEKTYEVLNRSIRKVKPEENGMQGVELYKSAAGDGIAWLKNTNFSNGVIEVDLAGSPRAEKP